MCVSLAMAANGSNDWLLTACRLVARHEFVCVRFVPFVYPVMVTGFVLFPLIVVTAPAYACAVGQLMLSATMKIVRLPS